MDFEIKIISQGWLGQDSEQDLCSHGEIYLQIGNKQISSDRQLGDDWSYGISEAALGLLRTLKYRHAGVNRIASRLIPHGCGSILMMGCDIGIEFDVRHREGVVYIDHVVRRDTNNPTEAVEFSDISVEIPWAVYAEMVVEFASQAKAYFMGIEKDISNEIIPGEYEAFWSEFDSILDGWEVPTERDLIRSGDYIDFHT